MLLTMESSSDPSSVIWSGRPALLMIPATLFWPARSFAKGEAVTLDSHSSLKLDKPPANYVSKSMTSMCELLNCAPPQLESVLPIPTPQKCWSFVLADVCG